MSAPGPRPVAAGFALALAALPATAQDGPGFFAGRTASVTYGPYVRAEVGGARLSPDDGRWQPAGASDPTVSLDFSTDDVNFGALGFGYDWMNGFRADLTFLSTGNGSIKGTCSSTSDGTPCADHVDSISTTLNTKALMVNVFYAPLEQRGSNSIFQPFLVAGVGLAHNSVGDWTRINDDATRPERSFDGASTDSFAWSVGFGAALQVTRPGKWPIILEAAYRYYDFGSAEGGAAPLPGNGSSRPTEPVRFDVTSQVVSIGVRIPLQRY